DIRRGIRTDTRRTGTTLRRSRWAPARRRRIDRIAVHGRMTGRQTAGRSGGRIHVPRSVLRRSHDLRRRRIASKSPAPAHPSGGSGGRKPGSARVASSTRLSSMRVDQWRRLVQRRICLRASALRGRCVETGRPRRTRSMTTRMASITAPRAHVGFPVLDADGHVAEPHDLWDGYCDPSHRQAATDELAIVDLPEGGSGLMLEGRCLVRGIEAVAVGRQNPRTFLGTQRWDEGYPGAFDPVHRLRDMDLEGIDIAMVFPSMVGALGGVSNARLAAAMARAYNRWV